MITGVGCLFLGVLRGRVLIKPIEQNIEVFFLVAGTVASALTGQWSAPLLRAALTEPIALTIAVLIFGVIARLARPTLDDLVSKLVGVIAPRWIYFAIVILL